MGIAAFLAYVGPVARENVAMKGSIGRIICAIGRRADRALAVVVGTIIFTAGRPLWWLYLLVQRFQGKDDR